MRFILSPRFPEIAAASNNKYFETFRAFISFYPSLISHALVAEGLLQFSLYTCPGPSLCVCIFERVINWRCNHSPQHGRGKT